MSAIHSNGRGACGRLEKRTSRESDTEISFSRRDAAGVGRAFYELRKCIRRSLTSPLKRGKERKTGEEINAVFSLTFTSNK